METEGWESRKGQEGQEGQVGVLMRKTHAKHALLETDM
jgi:hypothetical protein